MGEGQWEVDDSLLAHLNELDAGTEEAVANGDETGLRSALEAIATAVKSGGTRLDDSYLGPSELVVPPVDLTLAEARELMHGEGLIPDLP